MLLESSGYACILEKVNGNHNSNSKTPANNNGSQPKLHPREAAIQRILQDVPTLTREEVEEELATYGF